MHRNTALVLSGGGARGAYAVGVLQALSEVLQLGARDRGPFEIFSGTSVGSINTTFLAANAQHGDMNIAELSRLWSDLDIHHHLRVRDRWSRGGSLRGIWGASSLLDPRSLDVLVRRSVDFDQLARNVTQGVVAATMVAAFDISTAQTVIFSHVNERRAGRTPRDPTRRDTVGPLTIDHVLASSAMPFVFPSRKIDDHYYCDGGVRFNTPISPAIRAGAERLVVISLKYQNEHDEVHLAGYPSVPFMAGRLLNALLIDPFEYDLEVLGRFNRITAALERALPPAELESVQAVMRETRGAPYRHVDALVFAPSVDLGKLTHDHLQEHLHSYKVGALPRFLLRRAARPDATWEAEWAAYVLFDGRYAQRLIALGYSDALARADEIRAFFSERSGGV